MFPIVRGPDLTHACTTEYSNMYLTRLPASTPHPLTTTCMHGLLMVCSLSSADVGKSSPASSRSASVSSVGQVELSGAQDVAQQLLDADQAVPHRPAAPGTSSGIVPRGVSPKTSCLAGHSGGSMLVMKILAETKPT